MLPRVTLKSTIGINYFITIPEEVEGFSEDFKHNMSRIYSLEINSRYLKEINQNMASSMSRLKQLKVGDNFNGNIGSNVFRRSKLKAITLPKGVRKIEKHAFESSLLLQEAHVYLHTKVEEEAFPETCAIFYYGALTKEEIKRQNQLNKEAKKVLKNSKKHHKEQLQLEEKFSKQKQNGRVPNWLFEKQENERKIMLWVRFDIPVRICSMKPFCLWRRRSNAVCSLRISVRSMRYIPLLRDCRLQSCYLKRRLTARSKKSQKHLQPLSAVSINV